MNEPTNPLSLSYKHPVGRKLAVGRVLAVGRIPAVGRKRIGFIDDGKLHIVLDTNIVINALIAKRKGGSATQKEKDCLTIIEVWEKDVFALGIQGILFAEYQSVGEKRAREGKISSSEYGRLISLIEKRGYAFRVMVTKQHLPSNSYKDDHLFDGLAGDYLISEDEGVLKQQIKNPYRNYKKISNAANFTTDLKELGLI